MISFTVFSKKSSYQNNKLYYNPLPFTVVAILRIFPCFYLWATFPLKLDIELI